MWLEIMAAEYVNSKIIVGRHERKRPFFQLTKSHHERGGELVMGEPVMGILLYIITFLSSYSIHMIK